MAFPSSSQYPYLIQAVQWARSLDLTVLIDLHGAPGSQNGYDHSGRIGPVGFADNSTNEDRTIAVIRNLTAEFTQDIYGGTVKSELKLKITCETLAHSCSGIQLLNEPRLTDPTFTMDYLKQYYAEGIETALSVNRSQVNVTIHGELPRTGIRSQAHAVRRCLLGTQLLEQLRSQQ